MQVLSSVDSALVPADTASEESGESKEKDIGLYISFKFINTIQLKFLTQISPNPATVAFTEIFSGINFRPCGKDHHRLHVIISTEQKILPMGAGGEKGENS